MARSGKFQKIHLAILNRNEVVLGFGAFGGQPPENSMKFEKFPKAMDSTMNIPGSTGARARPFQIPIFGFGRV